MKIFQRETCVHQNKVKIIRENEVLSQLVDLVFFSVSNLTTLRGIKEELEGGAEAFACV